MYVFKLIATGMQILSLESEETSALQFRHQCLQFKHMYGNQLAIERNQVVIDAANYQMWTQMKTLLIEMLKMFMSIDRKMDRQFNALADVYIALAALAAREPTGLVTREEMVDKLKSEPLDDVTPLPEDKPIGYYLNILKKATTKRAFQPEDDIDKVTSDALAELRSRLQGLKVGEDFRLLQDDIPLAEDPVPERMAESKGLFQTLLDDVLAKVTNLPAAEYDLRSKIKAINQLKSQRHPTPAAEDTCLAHPEHYDPAKDTWDKERRRVKTVDERGMVGDFEKVTIAGASASADSLDYEPPERVVRIVPDSERSLKYVSSNTMSTKFHPGAPMPFGPPDDFEAVRAAKKAGWYEPSLVSGAPDYVEESWSRPGPSGAISRSTATTRPELQYPAWKITRTRGSSEDFESDQEINIDIEKHEVAEPRVEVPKAPVKSRLGRKSIKERLGPRKLLSAQPLRPNPIMGTRAMSGVMEPPKYEITNLVLNKNKKTSVNERLGARTMPVRQTKITEYQNQPSTDYSSHNFGSP